MIISVFDSKDVERSIINFHQYLQVFTEQLIACSYQTYYSENKA